MSAKEKDKRISEEKKEKKKNEQRKEEGSTLVIYVFRREVGVIFDPHFQVPIHKL